MFLTRDEIVAKQWPVEEIALPEFEGRKVRVKSLSAAEFIRLAESEKTHANKAYALWFIASVCDADGKLLFAEADIDFITALPIGTVNRVVEAAKRINKLPTGDDKDGPSGNSVPIPAAA